MKHQNDHRHYRDYTSKLKTNIGLRPSKRKQRHDIPTLIKSLVDGSRSIQDLPVLLERSNHYFPAIIIYHPVHKAGSEILLTRFSSL